MYKKNLLTVSIFFAASVLTNTGWATLNDALTTGNPALLQNVSENEIIDNASAMIDFYQRSQNKIYSGIYGNDVIKFAPSRNTSVLGITEQESVYPLLVGKLGNNLAVFGGGFGCPFCGIWFNTHSIFSKCR